jgi:hypothetical protein
MNATEALLSGLLVLVSVAAFSASHPPASQDARVASPGPGAVVSAAALDSEIDDFLDREFAAHVADIKSLNPPPERVVGALTTGEFSWGTFMRALAAYSQLSGKRTVAGQDVARLIGQMGLIESRRGGISFAQMYAALSLQDFGTDLNTNPLWQSLTPEQRQAWTSLLDPNRFYDRRTHRVINLPENYLGVAARVAAISYQLGLIQDRAYVDEVLDQAARQFTSGKLFSDDNPNVGRYDRYSNEYARYCYFAAEVAGRQDLLAALAPSLKTQMQLWWDLVSPDGYGYPWGRSLGVISYEDTLEIVAFLATHPEFRPAPLSALASAYDLAWKWQRHDFNDKTHLLSVFAFGRGDYSYISKEREWQQTTSFLGKLASAHPQFISALHQGNVTSFPAELQLPAVRRFQWFRQTGNRVDGVWVVRQGSLRFAVPFVTGTQPAISDYQPAPQGLPGFATPVEQVYPCLVPFLELADGSTIAATDGADEIRPAADGSSVTAVWKRWAPVGGKAGELRDPGITSTVTWRLDGQTLTREEQLVASQDTDVRRWWFAFTSTADHVDTQFSNQARSDVLESSEGQLTVRLVSADWPVEITLLATGDSVLGRGARGPIPLHILYQARNLHLHSAQAVHWIYRIRTSAH